MRRFGFLFIFICSLFCVRGAALRAQDYDSTKDRIVTGQVRVDGQTGEGRAHVTLYNSLYTLISQTATSSSGSYQFNGVRAGDVIVVVNLAGYQEASVKVTVYPNSPLTTVPPIDLVPLTEKKAPSPDETVDAAEFKLSKSARDEYQKGRADLDKRHADDAIGHLRRVVKDEPGFASGHYWLGVALVLKGDHAGAESSFRRASELDPGRADPYFGLGNALNLLNRPGDALPVLQKGLQISPHASVGLFEKSRAEFLMKDYSAAEQSAEDALKESPPPPPEIHLILANCSLRLHRYQQAASELASYLKLDPKSTSAPAAIETLNKLKAAGIHPDPPTTTVP